MYVCMYYVLCCAVKYVLCMHMILCVYIYAYAIKGQKKMSGITLYCSLCLRKCLSLKQTFTIWSMLTSLQAPEVYMCLPTSSSSQDTGQDDMTIWEFEL